MKKNFFTPIMIPIPKSKYLQKTVPMQPDIIIFKVVVQAKLEPHPASQESRHRI